MLLKMKQYLIVTFATMLIILGFFVFWLPIPFGALMMIVGVWLLVSYSAGFTDFMRAQRARYPKFNAWLSRQEVRLPKTIFQTLLKTRPQEA